MRSLLARLLPRRPVYARVCCLSPDARLSGLRVVITGGSRGLGRAMAARFARDGARVLIAGRDEGRLRAAAEEVGCDCLPLDVRDVSALDAFVARAAEMLGGLDALVNNAGISLHERGFLDVGPRQFDDQFDTNLRGGFFLTQAFVRHCAAAGGTKRVLFVSSETGETADERPYGLTKAALNSLVRGLAYRYAADGFRINAVAPGVTTSDMTGAAPDGDISCPYNMTGRYYLPEEVAEVACFLMSEASNCLNGQILVCNEGKTINARWK